MKYMQQLDSTCWFFHWHRSGGGHNSCPRGPLPKKCRTSSCFLSLQTLTFDSQFELWRDFCTVHLTAKFHHPMFNCSEVIVLTNKQTPLKIVISLSCATRLGNKLSNQYTSSTFMSLWNSDKSKRHTNILNGDFNHEDPTKQPTNITTSTRDYLALSSAITSNRWHTFPVLASIDSSSSSSSSDSLIMAEKTDKTRSIDNTSVITFHADAVRLIFKLLKFSQCRLYTVSNLHTNTPFNLHSQQNCTAHAYTQPAQYVNDATKQHNI